MVSVSVFHICFCLLNWNLLVLSFLVFSDIKIHVEYLNKLKYECCQNSKPEKSIVYVDTDKENCERYRQNDRENQQYNRTFQLVHTNYDLSGSVPELVSADQLEFTSVDSRLRHLKK